MNMFAFDSFEVDEFIEVLASFLAPVDVSGACVDAEIAPVFGICDLVFCYFSVFVSLKKKLTWVGIRYDSVDPEHKLKCVLDATAAPAWLDKGPVAQIIISNFDKFSK